MRRILLLLLVLFVGSLFAGCQSVTRDDQQNIRRYSRIADLNRRMLTDDMDALLLLDRPSMLSDWYIRPE